MATPEGQILKAVTDYLTAKRVLWFRMNTGAMSAEHNGKKRFMRFGTPGMADVVAFPSASLTNLCGECENVLTTVSIPAIYWLEVKTAKGKQSEAQKSFKDLVESHGHVYAVVRSVEDVMEVLK